MAVAMAACSLGLHLTADNSMRALDKIICSAPVLKASSILLDATTKPCYILHKTRLSSSGITIIPRAATVTNVEDGNQDETDTIPTPVVVIDQDSDPESTVVEITLVIGLGLLLDTMNALTNLGLNVVKANVYLDSSGQAQQVFHHKADTGRKVEDPELLEAIRIKCSVSSRSSFWTCASKGAVCSMWRTADRPGLLVDLVKIILTLTLMLNLENLTQRDSWLRQKFHVSYKGNKAMIKPLQQVLSNSLRYFLRRPTTEESSF
ncbi:hypothetical protein SESBI_09003 [Sesbania bispinosa]|nr:hypothetical protein SESBI_09003 [Sesbania bispinosa]